MADTDNPLAQIDWLGQLRTDKRVHYIAAKACWMPPPRPDVPVGCKTMMFQVLLPVWGGPAVKPGSDARVMMAVISTTS